MISALSPDFEAFMEKILDFLRENLHL